MSKTYLLSTKGVLTPKPGHIPTIGAKNGARTMGGMPPKTSTPGTMWGNLPVFGVRCRPSTVTGATKGDTPYHGVVGSKWRT